MLVSLIIPAHNEERMIGLCLDSVAQHTSDLIEIIVVDNASGDRTSEIAASKDGVRVIREENKGLTHARERGRSEARGEFVAFLDSDSRLPRNWFERVDRFFKENPTAVSLSGPAEYFDATRWQRMILNILWCAAAPVAYRLFGYMVFGAHFVVKQSALDAIGGFDRTIEFYGEDTDIARRLKTQGKVAFCMSFRVGTSARRFQQEGILKTSAIYALNYLWQAIRHRPFTTSHSDVR